MAKKKQNRKIKKKKRIVKPLKKRKIKVKKKAKIVKRPIKSKPKIVPTTEGVHKTKIRVIGIGGGGGSIISEIISRIKRADFVIANTDSRALKIIKRIRRFQFGQSLTHGLGTGMAPELGELAAQNEKEKIKKLFEGQDLSIIVACLGGGTGSGATPVFAKVSKNLGCLTYGIFTLPFSFEGEKKMEIAKEYLEKIKPNLNAYSVIPNERIFQIVEKNTPLKNSLSEINKRLAENLEGLIETICLAGLINIDFADLRTILEGRGRLIYLNTTEIDKLNKEEIAKKVISSPLYPYTIKGAKGILYNIVGDKDIQLSEVSEISKIISDSVNKNAKIIFGISQNQKYKNKIKITLLASGCGIKNDLLKPTQASQPGFNKPQKAEKPVVLSVKTKKKIRKPKSKKIITPNKVYSPRPKTGISKKIKLKPIFKPKPKPKLKPKPRPKPKPKKEIRPKTKIKTENKQEGLSGNMSAEVSSKDKDNPQGEKNLNRIKIRRNAFEAKKVIEEEEKELLEKEKIWELPAILRKKQ